MQRQANTDCPVGIRVLAAEEFNRPRRGDLVLDAKLLTQTAKESTQNAKEPSQSDGPEDTKKA